MEAQKYSLGEGFLFREHTFVMVRDNAYSSPRLVVDWMEELIVGLLLVENVFSWGEKHCPPPNHWVIGPQHRFRCKTTMLST